MDESVSVSESMRTKTVKDISSKKDLENYFRLNDPYLHLYEMGDLDSFFWPGTRWFGVKDVDSEDYLFVALLYTGGNSLPVFIAFANDESCDRSNVQYGIQLLQDIVDDLPAKFHSHLSPALISPLQSIYQSSCQLKHYKMKFCSSHDDNQGQLHQVDTSNVVPLSPSDVILVESFFEDSYPGNWFDPRMLQSKKMFGIYEHNGGSGSSPEVSDTAGVMGVLPSSISSSLSASKTPRLVAVAGVHVYSEEFGVAALGNIAVHPSSRCRGLARTVTAGLLKNLLGCCFSSPSSSSNTEEHAATLCKEDSRTTEKRDISYIGLNVEASNSGAIKCYQRLGFTIVAEFYEVMWDRRYAEAGFQDAVKNRNNEELQEKGPPNIIVIRGNTTSSRQAIFS